ncbi:MAG: T9SS type A sorting domain-containing protein [Saprospirales bacterium]|nr:T9SS type A sorting domain-containing protein [Saprospirales bacterium]
MNRKLLLFFPLLLLLSLVSRAQGTFTATGARVTNSAMTIEYSLGEIYTKPIGTPCSTVFYLVGVIQSTAECTTGTIEDPFGNQYTVKCYPNPAEGLITVETDFPGFREYRLTDIAAQTVAGGTLENSSIDLTTLPSGTYLLTLVSNDYQVFKTFKIIKL